MNKNLTIDNAFKPEQHSIEGCLAELEKYGSPHVTKSSGSSPYWWAGIKVFVVGKGITFEVDYSPAKTPREAVYGVYERLMQAMQRIKNNEYRQQ